MGNLQTSNTQQYYQNSQNDMKIDIDLGKPVVLELKPLLHWSLQQIRQIYAPFRQRKDHNSSDFSVYQEQCPSIYSTKCVKNVPITKIFFIDSLNVFQIVSILVLCAYTSYSYKIQFLFYVFDLDSSRGLQFKQLILSFKSLIRGFCILTNQTLPDNDLLQKYGQIMFSRADLNNDQCLQLGQVLSWFQGNNQGIFLFKRFQPTDVIGKEQYYIFNSFIPYNDIEIKMLYHKMEKEYKKIPLNEEDFQPLNTINYTFKRTQSKNFNQTGGILTQNKKIQTGGSYFKKTKRQSIMQQDDDQIEKQKKVYFNLMSKRQSQTKIMNETQEKKISVLPKFNQNECQVIQKGSDKQNSYFKMTQTRRPLRQTSKASLMNSTTKFKDSVLNSARQHSKPFNQMTSSSINKGSRTFRHKKNPTTNSWQATSLNISHVDLLKKKTHGKKFRNIIILKGKTITKTQIFDMRDYFESMSAGKKAILIENFIDSFNDQKYNHMKSVAASLFNFLDMDQNGKVTFKQLIQKLYPDLTADHYEIIKLWNNQYNQTFNLQRKIKANREHEQLKKRILPKTCANRYQQMFNFFDKQKKGYVSLQDLKRILSQVSTQKQLIEAFVQNDKDKDGKLNLKEFMHIILPIDLQIEGI